MYTSRLISPYLELFLIRCSWFWFKNTNTMLWTNHSWHSQIYQHQAWSLWTSLCHRALRFFLIRPCSTPMPVLNKTAAWNYFKCCFAAKNRKAYSSSRISRLFTANWNWNIIGNFHEWSRPLAEYHEDFAKIDEIFRKQIMFVRRKHSIPKIRRLFFNTSFLRRFFVRFKEHSKCLQNFVMVGTKIV